MQSVADCLHQGSTRIRAARAGQESNGQASRDTDRPRPVGAAGNAQSSLGRLLRVACGWQRDAISWASSPGCLKLTTCLARGNEKSKGGDRIASYADAHSRPNVAATAGLVTWPWRMLTPWANAGFSRTARSSPFLASCSTYG